MLLTVSLFIFALWILSRFLFPPKPRGDLDKIPGPPPSGFIRQLFTFRRSAGWDRRHVMMMEMFKKYGPIVHIPNSAVDIVLISDYESTHKVFIGSAKEFGGRPHHFRLHEMAQETGVLLSHPADATWKALRKASQRHLRQFGDGLSRLENIITEVAEDMFVEFNQQIGKPFDPKPVIFDTTLNSIAFLISGERTRSGDPVVEKMREYEDLFTICGSSSVPWKLRILDFFPWLRHFGVPGWKMIQRHQELERDVWQMVNDMNDANPDAHSLCRVLKADGNAIAKSGEVSFTNMDARKTSLQLLFAGVTTTSNTFYGGINLLAHHPEVQTKLFAEITAITGGTRDVALTDRPKMHYARASVLEFLRYISVVPFGVGHETVVNTELKGYSIPPGVVVSANQYAMHHDEKIWGDPFDFRPERFIDENGEMVPADHPHRKNLMPFGAGLRVCLGESLALTRLFLWTTSLVQRFTVRPAEGNNKKTMDSRFYTAQGVLRPTPYEILFNKR